MKTNKQTKKLLREKKFLQTPKQTIGTHKSMVCLIAKRVMKCLEVWRKRRVEERREVGKRVKRNSYPPPYLNISKIKWEKGGERNN